MPRAFFWMAYAAVWSAVSAVWWSEGKLPPLFAAACIGVNVAVFTIWAILLATGDA